MGGFIINKINKNVKGIFWGLTSGMLWGLDTALNGFVLLASPFILPDIRLISGTLLLAFFHDFISAIILTVDLLVRNELRGIFNILKTRSAHFVILAALFAGPLGMRSYLYAVDAIGSGLTATISAMYPAVAAVLGAIFLKDYLNKRGWIGLVLTIIAISILGYGNFSLGSQVVVGVSASLLCIFGWASESVITAYGMKEDITPKQALFIRQWTSSLAYLVFMFFEGNIIFSISAVTTSSIFILICVMSVIGTLSYQCYYSAINEIGPVKATGLNVTYSIWAIIFSIFLLGGNIEIKLIFSGLLIIIGSSLMIKE